MKRQENTNEHLLGRKPPWSAEVRGGPGSDRLLQDLYRPIAEFLYRLLEDQEAAEELTGQVFLGSFQKDNTAETEMIAVRLYKIAVALATTRIEKADPGKQAGGHASNFSLESEARSKAVRRSIRALPMQERLALILFKYQGLSVSQVSVVLGVSEGAARKLLSQALEDLRSELISLVQ